MLPSSKRLSIPLLKTVMDKGRLVHSSLFSVKILKTAHSSRFSVVVSKKIAKSAVDRNKTRRRTFAALSTLYGRITPGTHAVFMVKAPLLKASLQEITHALEEFFVKTELLK